MRRESPPFREGRGGEEVNAVLGLVGIIDSYIYKLPNPFDGPTAELDEKELPKETLTVPPIKKIAKPDPMGDAKEEHGKALDEFSNKAEQQ